MCEWTEMYKDRVETDYFGYFLGKYGPFIQEIIDNSSGKMFGMGEFGCGTANTTRALIENEIYGHYCYDNSWTMLDLARKNIGKADVLFHYHDILKPMPPRRYDLIHSHGVLEHFSDAGILKIVDNQMAMTDISIHYVPGNGYDDPSYGDERLMSISKWENILNRYNPKITSFNEGKDYIIILKNK